MIVATDISYLFKIIREIRYFDNEMYFVLNGRLKNAVRTTR